MSLHVASCSITTLVSERLNFEVVKLKCNCFQFNADVCCNYVKRDSFEFVMLSTILINLFYKKKFYNSCLHSVNTKIYLVIRFTYTLYECKYGHSISIFAFTINYFPYPVPNVTATIGHLDVVFHRQNVTIPVCRTWCVAVKVWKTIILAMEND